MNRGCNQKSVGEPRKNLCLVFLFSVSWLSLCIMCLLVWPNSRHYQKIQTPFFSFQFPLLTSSLVPAFAAAKGFLPSERRKKPIILVTEKNKEWDQSELVNVLVFVKTQTKDSSNSFPLVRMSFEIGFLHKQTKLAWPASKAKRRAQPSRLRVLDASELYGTGKWILWSESIRLLEWVRSLYSHSQWVKWPSAITERERNLRVLSEQCN